MGHGIRRRSIETALATAEQLQAADSYPYFPVIKEPIGNRVLLDNGTSLLVFGSCDYLGLSQDTRVKEAAAAAVAHFGTNTYGAQIFNGYTSLHRDLEHRLAAVLGKESALLFPSGMHANIGAIASMMQPGDVIINDRLNHGSIFMGCRLSQANIRTYRHNDMGRLRSILRQTQGAARVLIAVDGLFSADGDYAQLPTICALAEEFDALVLVDEAHSFGVIGPEGRGVVAHFGVEDRVDVITGTVSKAVGSVGGFVAGSTELIEGLRHMAPAYLLSRGSPPSAVAASLASLAILDLEGDALRHGLWSNVKLARDALARGELHLIEGESHLLAVPIGSDEDTVGIARRLTSKGVLTTAMIAPGAPSGKGRLRLTVTARHRQSEIEDGISLLAEAVANG
jgi:8-amino-7-oxononanoate synthase